MYYAIESKEDKAHIGFQKYLVVKNNVIYSSKDAIRKYGIPKLNKFFTEKKNYKIILDGRKIGEVFNVKIDDEGDHIYKDKLLTKNIKEGLVYVQNENSRILKSEARFITAIVVPEEYKEAQRKAYDSISKEEIDKISKLAKDKLLPLVMKRKELKQYKIKKADLIEEKISIHNKISYRNNEYFIGIYRYIFNAGGYNEFNIAFSVIKDKVYIITSQYDNETLFDGNMQIHGMLDVDGCGEDELIIEKEYAGHDEDIMNLEIYKQKADRNWTLINKIKTRSTL